MLTICDNEECLTKKVVHGSFETKKKYCLETALLSILHALIFVPHVQVNVHVKKGRGIWMRIIFNIYWNCYIQQSPLPTVINCCFVLVVIWTFVHLCWLSHWERTPELGCLSSSNHTLKILHFLSSWHVNWLSNDSSKKKQVFRDTDS